MEIKENGRKWKLRWDECGMDFKYFTKGGAERIVSGKGIKSTQRTRKGERKEKTGDDNKKERNESGNSGKSVGVGHALYTTLFYRKFPQTSDFLNFCHLRLHCTCCKSYKITFSFILLIRKPDQLCNCFLKTSNPFNFYKLWYQNHCSLDRCLYWPQIRSHKERKFLFVKLFTCSLCYRKIFVLWEEIHFYFSVLRLMEGLNMRPLNCIHVSLKEFPCFLVGKNFRNKVYQVF